MTGNNGVFPEPLMRSRKGASRKHHVPLRCAFSTDAPPGQQVAGFSLLVSVWKACRPGLEGRVCRSPSGDKAAGVSFLSAWLLLSPFLRKVADPGPWCWESQPSQCPSPFLSQKPFPASAWRGQARIWAPLSQPPPDPALHPDWGAVGRRKGGNGAADAQTAPQHPAPRGTGKPRGTISGVLKGTTQLRI